MMIASKIFLTISDLIRRMKFSSQKVSSKECILVSFTLDGLMNHDEWMKLNEDKLGNNDTHSNYLLDCHNPKDNSYRSTLTPRTSVLSHSLSTWSSHITNQISRLHTPQCAIRIHITQRLNTITSHHSKSHMIS